MNIAGVFGQKLYLELAYVKAERSLLKLMLSNAETFDFVTTIIDEEQFILESHRKIYLLIKKYIDLKYEERVKQIEVMCNDVESSKEFVNVLESELLYEGDDYKKLIIDYVREIKKYKLEESKKKIMNKIKLYESQGQFNESLTLSARTYKNTK